MPTSPNTPKDFSSMGSESFELAGQTKKTDKDNKNSGVILTIQEESPESLVLGKESILNGKSTGNFLIDTYNSINRFFLKRSKVKIKDKATFFHLLSVMINAGIPMVKALRSLVNQMEKTPRLQMIIDTIANNIESGSTLSGSLQNFPDVFYEQEIGMIESGEASGQLSKILENIAEDTEKAYMIKSKIKSAMMYPIVIFVLLIGVIVAMMVFVIPSLKSLFENQGAQLPLITRIVVGMSDFMVQKKLILALGALGVILAFYAFKKTSIGKYAFDKFKISVPIFGTLFKKSYLARFARSLSNLLDSNISIVRAIEITANSIGNDVYKKSLMLAMEDIKQGIPLGESLLENPLFPPMLVNMIEVGEKTAQLDEISAKVAKFYEEEVDTAVSGISKIIEPVILVVIGVTVGGVVAAIMLPIMQLSDIAGSL
jgi:type IV pilus assembly protein PilC